MATIDWPAAIAPRANNWRQVGGVLLQRSEFTGATSPLIYGTAARWTCDVELPPMKAASALLWRAFVFALRGGLNAFPLEAADADQHGGTPGVVIDGAGQGGFTLAVSSASIASVTLLPAGALITVSYGSGDKQLIGLTEPLEFDGAGEATATLGSPLRGSPTDASAVETKRPYALMRAADPAAWSVEPGLIYRHALQAVEAF